MRNSSTSRTARTRRAVAIAVGAGLASTLGIGAAWAETVPPSTVHDPIVFAMFHAGAEPHENGYDEWKVGETDGTPGVTTTSGGGGAGSTWSASSTADLPAGSLSAAAAAVHNNTALNRAVSEAHVRDGLYLAEPATVTLAYTMTGQTTASGYGHGDLDITVAIDCVWREGGCFPDDDEDDVRGHRQWAMDGYPMNETGAVAIPLAAGWHRVDAIVLADGRASRAGGGSATGDLDFALTVPAGTRWASDSGLLTVTGGTEIEDTPAPPPPPPAPTPAEELSDLAASITSAKADRQIRNDRPLMSKVEAAQTALAQGNEAAAADALTSLRNYLRAQSGKHVPAPLATSWSQDAAAILGML